MVYARRRSGSTELFYLEDNTADQLREFTRTELLCPVPSCPAPAIDAVHRKLHRDGFRHRSGAEHGSESLFHLEGKGRIARWLRSTYPYANVAEEQPTTADRERVADVMATFPDGQRVAFEVQYATLTVDEWRTRHESYRAQGIIDVWLFGHHGRQFKTGKTAGDVTLNAVHRELVAGGGTLLWFNPFENLIGSAATTAYFNGRIQHVFSYDRSGSFTVEPLDTFTLTQHGLTNSRLDQLRVASHGHLYAMAELARKTSAREAQETRGAAERAQQAEARREAAERQAAVLAARRDELRAAWFASSEGQAALGRFDGVWPAWLATPVRAATAVPAEVWQWFLYSTFVKPKRPSLWVRRDIAAQNLLDEFGDLIELTRDQVAASLVTPFFDGLTFERILTKETVKLKYGRKGTKYLRAAPCPAPVPGAEKRISAMFGRYLERDPSVGRTDRQA